MNSSEIQSKHSCSVKQVIPRYGKKIERSHMTMKKNREAMAVIPEGAPYRQCWFGCKQTFSFSSSSKTHQLLSSHLGHFPFYCLFSGYPFQLSAFSLMNPRILSLIPFSLFSNPFNPEGSPYSLPHYTPVLSA